MESRRYLFVTILVGSLCKLNTGQFSGTLSITQTSKILYNEGETFSLTCTIELDNPGPMVQVLKANSYVNTMRGFTSWGSDELPVMIISNFTEMNPDIQDPRYTVQSTEANSYTLTITDVKPEDTGNYTCRILDAENKQTLSLQAITVLAPISNIVPVYGGVDGNYTEAIDGVLTFRYNRTAEAEGFSNFEHGPVGCKVSTSTSPIVWYEMMLVDMDTNKETNITDWFSDSSVYTHTETSVSQGGLIKHDMDSYFKTNHLWTEPKVDYNEAGKKLVCKAKVQGFNEEKEGSAILNLQFEPAAEYETCDVGSGKVTVGYKNFFIMCTSMANPVPEIIWSPKDGEQLRDGITVNTTVTGFNVVSLLIIDIMEEEDFNTVFTFKARNEFGESVQTKELQLEKTDDDDEVYLPNLNMDETNKDGLSNACQTVPLRLMILIGFTSLLYKFF